MSLTPELQTIVDQTFQKIHDIEDMLLKRDPMMPMHLANIHKTLIQYEELAHLLSDEQIHQLIKGQTQVTGIEIVKATTSKSKSSITRQARSISADDL